MTTRTSTSCVVFEFTAWNISAVALVWIQSLCYPCKFSGNLLNIEDVRGMLTGRPVMGQFPKQARVA